MAYSGARPKAFTLATFGMYGPFRPLTMATFGYLEHQPDCLIFGF